VQHVNATWIPIGWLYNRPGLLGIETVAWAALVAVAVRRRRALWLFAVAWMIVSVLPYVATQYGSGAGATVSLAVAGDRYLYIATCGAAIVLVESVRWLCEEIGVRWGTRGASVAGASAVLAILGFVLANIATLNQREGEWDMAGRIVRQVVTGVQPTIGRLQTGDTLCLGGIPRTYGNRPAFLQYADRAIYLVNGRADVKLRLAYLAAPWEAANPPLDTAGCIAVLYYDRKSGGMRAP
jgi:hypothetical protein